jgi:type 1 glutamine amidotransferase
MLVVIQAAPYHGADDAGPSWRVPAGVHQVLGQAAQAIAQIADLNGLQAQRVEDVRALDDVALYKARAVVLFTIGETPWNRVQRAEITGRLRTGELAVVAVHSATDSCYGWDRYGQIVGARFDGHPWTQTFTMDVVEPSHPAVAHLGGEWRWHDEVYQFRDLRPDARVLLRVRDGELDFDVEHARPPSFGYPLSWRFEEGAGRVFSTSLGHFPEAWESTAFLQHLNGGMAWALGANDVAPLPNATSSIHSR